MRVKKLMDDVDPAAPTLVAGAPPTTFFRRPRVVKVVKWVKRLAIAAAVLLVAALVAAWLLIRHYEADLPSVAELERGYHPSQVTRVLARDGTHARRDLHRAPHRRAASTSCRRT